MKTQTDINIIETQRSTSTSNPKGSPTDTQTVSGTRTSRHLQLDQWLEQVNAQTVFSKAVHDVSLEGYRVGSETVIVLSLIHI